MTLTRPAGALAALAASEAAAAPTLDDRIQSVFGPVADTLSGFVFVEVPLPGGLSAPLIVLWLAAAACLFTVYFRFINVRGFAHGFLVLSKEAVFTYKVDNLYAPQHEASIRWNDETVGIKWPIDPKDVVTSEKDLKGKSFAEADVFE